MKPPMVKVENISKVYGRSTVVDEVSFKVGRGEIFGLLGPNGAGKTTTFKILSGLIQADNGLIVLDGEISGPFSREIRRKIGMVPQDLAFYPTLTARENLSFFGSIYGIKGPVLHEQVHELLSNVSLFDRADEQVFRFSNGMKRRLNLIIGLIHKPSILLLDEPTVGVDPQSRNAILGVLESLAMNGVSIIYTTHYMEEAERICDRVAIMDRGKIIIEGSSSELLAGLPKWTVKMTFDSGIAPDFPVQLEQLSNVKAIHKTGNKVSLEVPDLEETLDSLLKIIKTNENQIINLEIQNSTLETLFLNLTGKDYFNE